MALACPIKVRMHGISFFVWVFLVVVFLGAELLFNFGLFLGLAVCALLVAAVSNFLIPMQELQLFGVLAVVIALPLSLVHAIKRKSLQPLQGLIGLSAEVVALDLKARSGVIRLSEDAPFRREGLGFVSEVPLGIGQEVIIIAARRKNVVGVIPSGFQRA